MSAVLSVRNLSVRFPAGPEVPAVDGLDLDLEAGEIVGLVGESGSGKTATAQAILNLLPPGVTTADSVRLEGQELLGIGERAWRRIRGRRISMVFQEPQSALDPVMTVGRQLRAVLLRHGVARRDSAPGMVADALRRMRLSDAEDLMRRYPHQLSGGMRQRIVIAMAMACSPAVLIADEPTTALDVTTQAQVLSELLRLGREHRTAILLITHDLGVAATICDRILVMHEGRLVESAPAETLMSQPRHACTRELIAAMPRLDDPLPAIPRAGQDAILSLQHRVVSHAVPSGGKRRRLVAVNDVGLDIRRGEILGLVGESGCGKTTLAQSLVGLKLADGGSMQFAGQPVAGSRPGDWARVRRHVQIVFQDPRASLSPRRTVGQSLVEPLDHFRIDAPASRPARVAQALDRVGLDPTLAGRYPHELSGGQRQRVALARALISEPDLVIADEPLSSLDVSLQARIIRLLRDLQRDLGFAVLIVSHDLAVIRQLADRVAVMYLGRVVESAPVAELFDRPLHPYTRALMSAIPGRRRDGDVRTAGGLPLRGEPPSPLTPPPGCVFHTRCPEAMARCARVVPPETVVGQAADTTTAHRVHCLLYEQDHAPVAS